MNVSRWRPTSFLIGTIALAMASSVTQAQGVHGTVRDSTSRQAIPGAVITLYDSAGRTLGRGITNDGGIYSIAATAVARRLRLQRIGFRPLDAIVPSAAGGGAALDLAMQALSSMLEPVITTASACPRRSNPEAAMALLEQAKSGLLATVVAREANTASMARFAYRKRMDGNSDRIEHMSVRSDTAHESSVSFHAAFAGRDFATRGFIAIDDGQETYFGPDPEVLLDDAFVAAYCFHLVDHDRGRPNQVGLGFAPADRRRGRIDIEGALWIDTISRTLHDIDFRYVGFDHDISDFRPGGSISFRQMPNGIALVDRWRLRLVGTEADTVLVGPRMDMRIRRTLFAQESGGELARAAWPGGASWIGSLGRLQIQARSADGSPVAGTVIRLPDTPYEGRIGMDGRLELADLVPGPYTAVVVEPHLAKIGQTIATPLKFVVDRDAVVRATLEVPTLQDYARKRCSDEGRFERGDTTFIVGRVETADGKPVKGTVVNVSVQDQHFNWVGVGSYKTGTNGLFQFCPKVLARHSLTRVGVNVLPQAVVEIKTDEEVSVVRVVVPPR